MKLGFLRSVFFLFTLLFCFQSFAQNSSLNVPLKLRDVTGTTRINEPCSTGIPLPAGLLKDCSEIAVYNSAGKAIPAQFKTLERWNEYGDSHSIKWLLVTFMADVPPFGTSTYYLRKGANPQPTKPVSISDNGTSFRVADQDFQKNFSGPFQLVLTEPDGVTKVNASELRTIRWSIEENGPIRAVLKAESDTEPDKFGFIAWIYAYAGQHRWDMKVVLKNTPRTARGPLYFKDFSVVWNRLGSTYVLGGDPRSTYTGSLKPEDSVYLYQDSSGTDRWDKLGEQQDGIGSFVIGWSPIWQEGLPKFRGYKVMHHNEELGSGNHALGWARLADAYVANRWFWQQNPKAVEVGYNRITVHLWPEYWQGHGGIHWLDDMQRKSHDVSFRIGNFGDNEAQAFNSPLVAYCGKEWYQRTGVIGYISSRFTEASKPDPANAGRWEYNWVNFGGYALDRIRRRYHDFPMENFIRTGDPYSAYMVKIAENHSAGMTPLWLDSYEYPSDSSMLRPYTYCSTARDSGKYSPVSGHHGYMIWDPEHWTASELFDGWRLFGDPLAYDAIKEMTTYLRFYADWRKTHPAGETRWDALPMVVLCEGYRITEDPGVMKTINDYMDLIWDTVNKERGYYIPNAALGAEKPFMITTLVDGLREYYSLTHSERTFDMIKGLVDYCIDEAYVNKCYSFLYTSPIDPSTHEATMQKALSSSKAQCTGGWSQNWQMARPIAWLYLQTGHARYKQLFDELIDGAVLTTSWASMLAGSSEWDATCDQVHEVARNDTQSPEKISDLKATVVPAGIQLTWTTPADAARYQVKYAKLPILAKIKWPDEATTAVNWWSAQNVTGEPIPGDSGARQQFTIPVSEGGTYYFCIRSYDASSNQSELSNLALVNASAKDKPAPPTRLQLIESPSSAGS